mgnify:CR=1 FL=1
MKIDIENNTAYLHRILFTFIIALEHSGLVARDHQSYYLGVDYFFIISGFMVVWDSERRKEITVFDYMKYRIKKLFPAQFLLYICWIIYVIVMNHSIAYGIGAFIKHLPEAIPGFYFWGTYDLMGGYAYNFAVWYLSVLVLVSSCIYYLYTQKKQLFIGIITPIGMIFSYAYIVNNYTNFNAGGSYITYYVRGIGGMMCGALLYIGISKMLTKKYSKIFFKIMRVIELILLSFILWMIGEKGNTYYDILIIIAMYGLCFCSFIYPEEGKSVPLCIKKASGLMYYVYMAHLLVKNIFNAIPYTYELITPVRIIFYFAAVLLAGVIEKEALKVLDKGYIKLKKRICLEEKNDEKR